jgi:Fur family peroxide stress response transcriptional regulator
MAILHTLRHAGKHLSPRDVYARAKKEFPSLTEPTVYRALEFLAENGLVRLAQAGRGHLTYEIAGEDHHHLVCRVCGSGIEVEHHLVEKLYRTLEAESRYARIGSHLTFSGICPDCQQG